MWVLDSQFKRLGYGISFFLSMTPRSAPIFSDRNQEIMSKTHLNVVARGILFLVFATAFAGCAKKYGDLGQVTGTVKLDSQPLADAYVEFIPAEGRSSFAQTDDQGHYELSYVGAAMGAVPGEHRVEITTKPISGGDGKPERLPAKYNRRSELIREVVQGEQTIDFDLESK